MTVSVVGVWLRSRYGRVAWCLRFVGGSVHISRVALYSPGIHAVEINHSFNFFHSPEQARFAET
ncbi:hypothetical protein BDZ89DRAFT_1061096 [Hymenopellis radicata]|nr:hypothetical protein BDZ89DRAFT_1061096 [Hymenopellis radicata]